MSRIKNKDTKPELLVRQLLHQLGYRYRLHVRGIPGTPDIVFPSKKKVVFVHGCFWHQHTGCSLSRIPKSRTRFWMSKFAENKTRDAAKNVSLIGLGWSTFVVWECELTDPIRLALRLIQYLETECLDETS